MSKLIETQKEITGQNTDKMAAILFLGRASSEMVMSYFSAKKLSARRGIHLICVFSQHPIFKGTDIRAAVNVIFQFPVEDINRFLLA